MEVFRFGRRTLALSIGSPYAPSPAFCALRVDHPANGETELFQTRYERF
jgi:hypothetical protein